MSRFVNDCEVIHGVGVDGIGEVLPFLPLFFSLFLFFLPFFVFFVFLRCSLRILGPLG